MTLPYKIGTSVLALLMACSVGYFYGRQHGREATLKAAVAAYQTRKTINHETKNLNPVALCAALGGMPEQCAALLRRMDKTATGE